MASSRGLNGIQQLLATEQEAQQIVNAARMELGHILALPNTYTHTIVTLNFTARI
ncbi:hypothetical protein TIFTF001_020250 [Ficus carica]|uniref:Uncharacterized protein n=1 Tax=Ficus carica TaxID=3494 RepID=A0AA88AAF5_FICCA|nr:hypothetical protein TIFTF001_020250 [Ficus carica]